MSQKKKLPTVHLKILKAFIEGQSFKEISEAFEEVKYRSTAQWIVRKCQGKINDSVSVITEALQKDILTQQQIQSLLASLMGALLRTDVNDQEKSLNTEVNKETPFYNIEVEEFDEFFERIRKYFEKIFSE